MREEREQQRAEEEHKKAEEREGRADQEKIKEAVTELVKVGIVTKIKPDTREAWVDPLAWAMADHEGKENVAWFLAAYVTGRPLGEGTIDIYDHQSGKKLAKIGIFGFKVY